MLALLQILCLSTFGLYQAQSKLGMGGAGTVTTRFVRPTVLAPRDRQRHWAASHALQLACMLLKCWGFTVGEENSAGEGRGLVLSYREHGFYILYVD